MSLQLRLSEPGTALKLDPAMSEYLRAYNFPLPPQVRYGQLRLRSPQPRHGVTLFAQAWLPAHAVGSVFLLHGYSEHSGNYSRLVRELTAHQLAVICFDLRGHGLSEGPSGHAPEPLTYAEDAEAVLGAMLPGVLPTRPLFLWGHSMGGLVALQLLLRKALPVLPAAAVVSSPLLGFPELHGVQRLLAGVSPFLARLIPALPVSHGVPPEFLSHDEIYLARRHDDPLVKKVTTPRWFESMKMAVKELHRRAPELHSLAPTLLLLAGAEKVTSLSEARRFAFQAYAGPRHKVIEFPGLYHELEKEPAARDRVVSESIAWFRSHAV